ncbi:hypothetical protein C8Q80DRAFT_800521 [Daedaleopsis nitida]|nr:hypothetical protein C8Q80DRAFT_800521 [Daedaleopsis nitida]
MSPKIWLVTVHRLARDRDPGVLMRSQHYLPSTSPTACNQVCIGWIYGVLCGGAGPQLEHQASSLPGRSILRYLASSSGRPSHPAYDAPTNPTAGLKDSYESYVPPGDPRKGMEVVYKLASLEDPLLHSSSVQVEGDTAPGGGREVRIVVGERG